MIYVAIILLLLYARTWNYKKIIDDNVPREGYLRQLTLKSIDWKFYDEKRPIMYCITNIMTYFGVCLAIYMLFGIKAAVLYAVYPLLVSAGTWSVGNMYMTTVLFVLTGYYFLLNYQWGFIVSGIFFFASLHSTVSSMFYPFYLLTAIMLGLKVGYPAILLHFLVLALFMSGKRFQNGMKLRKEAQKEVGVKSKLRFKNIFVIVKVIGAYIYWHLVPYKLALFPGWCKEDFKRLYSPTLKFWLAGILTLAFSLVLFQLNPLMCVWFILSIGLFSQYILAGQFMAERYTYFSAVALCVVLAQLPNEVYLVLVTLYFYRSHLYVGAWEHNKYLFSNGVVNFPKAEENYNNLGRFYFERGNWIEAIKPYLVALKMAHGDKFKIRVNLASCYMSIQMYHEAFYHVTEALKIAPEARKGELKDLYFKLNDKVRKTTRLRQQLVRA